MPKKTFEAAATARAHLIVQLKENQLSLCRRIEAFCRSTKPLSVTKTVDKNKRNRHETRTVSVFDASRAVAGTEWEAYVAALIQVERVVHAFLPSSGLWKTSTEVSFYLSNRPLSAQQAAEAIRGHWGIENSFHHVRDVTLREDASRIRTNPGVFARLRSFAYNVLRSNPSNTLPQHRYALALAGLNALATLFL